MGINGLWGYFKDCGVLKALDGVELVKELEEKALAVDVSPWMIQAHTQKAYGHEFAHGKVRKK